jgi:hypothetical protein
MVEYSNPIQMGEIKVLDLSCDEELTDDISPYTDSPSMDMVLSPRVYGISPGMEEKRCVPSKEEASDTFTAWRRVHSPMIPYNQYFHPEFLGKMTEWILYIETYVRSAGMGWIPVYHTVNLFLRYINSPDVYLEYSSKAPLVQWESLVWYRTACLWIALKVEDLKFEYVDSMVPADEPDVEQSRKILIMNEMEVLNALGFVVAPPKEFPEVMGILLEIPDDIIENSKKLLHRLMCFPAIWCGERYDFMCASAIIATWEMMGGNRKLVEDNPFSYVYQIENLGVGKIGDLYSKADTMLTVMNNNRDFEF